jgi:hypothetical protein
MFGALLSRVPDPYTLMSFFPSTPAPSRSFFFPEFSAFSPVWLSSAANLLLAYSL